LALRLRFQRVWGLEVVGAGLVRKSAITAVGAGLVGKSVVIAEELTVKPARTSTKPAPTKGCPLPNSQGLAD